MKKFIHIDETDFSMAWARIIKNILHNPHKSTKSGAPILDSILTVQLQRSAISQVESHEIHPQFPFRHVSEYADEFTYEYQDEYMNKAEEERFEYTYFDRFVAHHGTDQLKSMRNNLILQKESGSSNRTLMITWHPTSDIESLTPPCLQWIQVKYIGNNKVEVFTTWRSRDAFSAWQANIVALIQMLNEYVVRPANCEISTYTEFVSSAHIYESDIAEATKVNLYKSSFRGV